MAEKRFICEECGKEFSSKEDLEAHKEEHEKVLSLTIPTPKIGNKWAVASVILLFLFIGSFFTNGFGFSPTGMVVSAETMSPDDAANKAIDWITSYYKSGGVDVEASLVDASETENGIYQFTVKLSSTEGENEQTLYVTKDGKLFIPQVIETEEIIPETSETSKSDRPEAHAFVMSYCPYGLQFIKAYIPVIELLGDKADIELNFVHYLMHGEKEMIENTRMYCIQKEQNDKFTDYLRCFVESGDAETCISDAGIDKNQLETCMQNTDEQFEITKTFEESQDTYPPYLVDAVLAQQYGVRGSPTFVVNGQTVSVDRSPEAIKQAICSAFNTPPEECEQELSTTAEQPGIGPIGSGSGASSGGQC
jgi:hypothetical protein